MYGLNILKNYDDVLAFMEKFQYKSLVLISEYDKPLYVRPIAQSANEIHQLIAADATTKIHYYGSMFFADKGENIAQFLISLLLEYGIRPDFQLRCKGQDFMPLQLIDCSTNDVLIDYESDNVTKLYKSSYETLEKISEEYEQES